MVDARGFPQRRSPREDVLELIDRAVAGDVDWRAGVHQGSFYFAGDDVLDVSLAAYERCYHTNPLLRSVLPSASILEEGLIAGVADLLHAPLPIGVVTTGGTESNLLAVWGALRRGESRGVTRTDANIVVPVSSHPSFVKAATYFGIEIRRVPIDEDLRADIEAMDDAIDAETVLLVGSAPSYPHGVVDPVDELGAVAQRHRVDLHVDACVGGLFLPFVEELGVDVPPFDFRVAGVTTMSADLHKHGFSAKGVSTLIHRSEAVRDVTTFRFDDWPNGSYITNTITGTRSGGSVASAYAVIHLLGREGFREIVGRVLRLTGRFIQAIDATEGYRVLGKPLTNKFAMTCEGDLEVDAVADALEGMGWSVGRQSQPPAINMHVGLVHEATLDRFIRDLTVARERVRVGDVVRSGKSSSYT